MELPVVLFWSGVREASTKQSVFRLPRAGRLGLGLRALAGGIPPWPKSLLGYFSLDIDKPRPLKSGAGEQCINNDGPPLGARWAASHLMIIE